MIKLTFIKSMKLLLVVFLGGNTITAGAIAGSDPLPMNLYLEYARASAEWTWRSLSLASSTTKPVI